MVPILLCSEFEIHFTFFFIPKTFFCQEELATSSNHFVKGEKITGGRASAVFGEALCLPAGRQGGTFPCLTAETKSLGSNLTTP
jgi:hypothetical protein